MRSAGEPERVYSQYIASKAVLPMFRTSFRRFCFFDLRRSTAQVRFGNESSTAKSPLKHKNLE